MLHVTNGDSVVATMAGAGFPGNYLSWQDVLHEGPVPAMPDEVLRAVRARFLAERGWSAYENALAQLEARDRALLEADELVLWFEADLFDQLQLIQILDRVARASRPARLICIGAFPGRPGFAGLGELDTRELASLLGTELDVTESERVLARRAWAAFRSPDPIDLAQIAEESCSSLPFLAEALVRHLEQFPAVEDGLSRVERDILELAAERPRSSLELFRAQAEREERRFMGDAIFCDFVDGLAGAPVPLVEREGETVSLTEAGRAVLGGEADAMALNEIDRWLGGVHLTGEPSWRWNRAARQLEAQRGPPVAPLEG